MLTSNGPGVAPSYQAAGGGGGGALVLLEEHTASSSASLDFTASFSATYDDYLIEIIGLNAGTNQAQPWIRFSTNGGSTWDASSIYDWSAFVQFIGGSASAQNQQASQAAGILFGDGAGGELAFDREIQGWTRRSNQESA